MEKGTVTISYMIYDGFFVFDEGTPKPQNEHMFCLSSNNDNEYEYPGIKEFSLMHECLYNISTEDDWYRKNIDLIENSFETIALSSEKGIIVNELKRLLPLLDKPKMLYYCLNIIKSLGHGYYELLSEEILGLLNNVSCGGIFTEFLKKNFPNIIQQKLI